MNLAGSDGPALPATPSFLDSFSSDTTFQMSLCPIFSFPLRVCTRVINNKHIPESMLCYLEIASAKEINMLLFKLAAVNSQSIAESKESLCKKKKKKSQEWAQAQLLLRFLLPCRTSMMGIQGLLWLSLLPGSQDGQLSPASGIQLCFQSKVPKLSKFFPKPTRSDTGQQ